MNTWHAIITIILAFIGFLISRKIIRAKEKSEVLTCPFGGDCDEVVHSRYSKFFGISNVYVGWFYYVGVIIFFVANFFYDFNYITHMIVLGLSGLAIDFSVYLAGVQAFVLRKWCTWCLMCLLVNFLIFIVIFVGVDGSFTEFLFDNRDLLSFSYIMFAAVGVFAITRHTVTFVKFLKDFKITRREERILRINSQISWVAILGLVITGVGLVATDIYWSIVTAPTFYTMLVVLAMLVIYEIILNAKIAPHLIGIHFGDVEQYDDAQHAWQRKQAFALAAVGTISWYMMLFMSIFPNISIPNGTLFAIYLGLLVAGVLVALFAEFRIYQKSLLHRDEEKLEAEDIEY